MVNRRLTSPVQFIFRHPLHVPAEFSWLLDFPLLEAEYLATNPTGLLPLSLDVLSPGPALYIHFQLLGKGLNNIARIVKLPEDHCVVNYFFGDRIRIFDITNIDQIRIRIYLVSQKLLNTNIFGPPNIVIYLLNRIYSDQNIKIYSNTK